MKASIRLKFSLGIFFLFIIIVLLSIFSAYFVNKLSNKTAAILKENHLSVIFARDMSENLTNINMEITRGLLSNQTPDTMLIKKEFGFFEKSLTLEKNDFTEPGEDKLVASIDANFNDYRKSVLQFTEQAKPLVTIQTLQKKFIDLYEQEMFLSQMNSKAIEAKTEDAKLTANSALKQMTILATLCFIITVTFTYSFASYFNTRFFQLFNGIKEIVASNFGQRLHFNGTDEFHEISLVFNKMAENLSNINKGSGSTVAKELNNDESGNDIQDMKEMLNRLKSLEEQASELISRLENTNSK